MDSLPNQIALMMGNKGFRHSGTSAGAMSFVGMGNGTLIKITLPSDTPDDISQAATDLVAEAIARVTAGQSDG